jgi:hypothetical protein
MLKNDDRYFPDLRTIFAYAACAALAGCPSSPSHGPTINRVQPGAFTTNGTNYELSLIVEFDDSSSHEGDPSIAHDLVGAFTLVTDETPPLVDLEQQPIDPPSASPVTISGITVPMSAFGVAPVGFDLTLHGASSGIGPKYAGTVNIYVEHGGTVIDITGG